MGRYSYKEEPEQKAEDRLLMIDNQSVRFTGIENADGLTDDESRMMRSLVAVFNDRLANNQRRMEYYEDKNPLKNIGLTIPQSIASKIDTHVGWAAKAVDYLAARSIFDGFTAQDGDEGELERIMRDNDFSVEYMKAVPTQLVHGVGFWTVSRGGKGEPSVIINYHNATGAAALWDFRHKRISCGFVIEDYELTSVNGREEYSPSFVVMHTPYAVLEIERRADGWHAARKPHMQGRCLMVPMAYRPQDTKPFGKSRVSRTVMGITDEMQREIMRSSLHSEVFASGQKALLGVSDEQYDELQGAKFRAAVSELFLATRDENGDIPTITQFAQQSMEPHIAAMESLMSRMAAETAVPVAAFGLSSNGYTSSDALRASSDDLILEAENLNRNNGKALVEIAKLALAVVGNTTVASLPEYASALEVHWVDPSMPSAASVADATVKLAGAVPEFAGTDVFWELNGFSEDQRRRVRSDMLKNESRAAVNAIFGKQVSDEGAA